MGLREGTRIWVTVRVRQGLGSGSEVWVGIIRGVRVGIMINVMVRVRIFIYKNICNIIKKVKLK